MPDEADFVGMFRGRLGIRGDPDDIEALPPRASCWCVDTLSAGTDILPGMGLRRAARKSVAACVSDLAAKGAAPVSGLASVSLPPGASARYASAVASGLADAAGEFGFPFAGGDTGRGEELSITVCLAGAGAPGRRGRRWPGRGGARPGDLVLATGAFGLTAAGREILMGRAAGARGRFAGAARRASYLPACRTGFGQAAAGMFTSSTDTSDGLAAALSEMARSSRMELAIADIPYAPGLERFAAAHGLDAEQLALNGGEEYEIVFTARPSDMSRIEEVARRSRTPVSALGRVEGSGRRGAGSRGGTGGGGAHIVGDDGGRRRRGIRGGWRHSFGSGTGAGGRGGGR